MPGSVSTTEVLTNEVLTNEVSITEVSINESEAGAADARPELGDKRLLAISAQADERAASVAVLKALGSLPRLAILEYLQLKVANVSEIAQALDMPLSTANLHVSVLEEAGLIRSELVTASRGVQKLCARLYDAVNVTLPRTAALTKGYATIEMPVGAFSDCQVAPTCGLVSAERIIGWIDDPASFYEPARVTAQLLWFSHGYLEYRFPYRHDGQHPLQSLALSAEICSEAAPFAPDWPSDIFLEINGRQIGVWTSPGDFGGERGQLTPAWWGETNSQYGLLKTWRVDGSGSYVDGAHASAVRLAELKLADQPFIRVRLGVRPDAPNAGGLNLFGKTFGNHAQDIVLKLTY